MPPRYTQQQYNDRIVRRVQDDGAIIVEDLGSGRAYDGIDQAFIVCAVLHFTRDKARDAYWRYKEKQGDEKMSPAALDPKQDEHWNNVRAIAHGTYMRGLVTECLGSLTPQLKARLESPATTTDIIKHGQPNIAIHDAFTERPRPNASIIIKRPSLGLEFDMRRQAFILCAVTNKLLGPESLSDAYWSYEGDKGGPYVADTLREIATYIHDRRLFYEDARMFDVHYWNAVLNMANDPQMQADVESHLPGGRQRDATVEAWNSYPREKTWAPYLTLPNTYSIYSPTNSKSPIPPAAACYADEIHLYGVLVNRAERSHIDEEKQCSSVLVVGKNTWMLR
ncbi:hypothetical protein G7Y79_00009g027410 [Physcia stellaris]|nr:hypothetical protein G7Y79_00009g027410 [Physcia stellaris]